MSGISIFNSVHNGWEEEEMNVFEIGCLVTVLFLFLVNVILIIIRLKIEEEAHKDFLEFKRKMEEIYRDS